MSIAYSLARRLSFLTLVAGPLAAQAQEIEPRAFSNAPIGMNFLILGYVYTTGGIAFDSSVPVENPQLRTSTGILAYSRVLDLWGMSGRVDVVAPYTRLTGSAKYLGQPVTRDVTGFVDTAFRLSVNFYGAPALTVREFRAYKQDIILGASLQVSAPWGQYDSERLINIGTNRWTVRPQLGVSKALGPWVFEAASAIGLFTDNNNFLTTSTRSQTALYSFQGHVSYGFVAGSWASIDAVYFVGGRTTVDDDLNDDLQSNWRLGGTLAFPFSEQSSIKLYGSTGVSARTGNNFDQVGVAWQYRWDVHS
jgi:hypothetical protein